MCEEDEVADTVVGDHGDDGDSSDADASIGEGGAEVSVGGCGDGGGVNASIGEDKDVGGAGSVGECGDGGGASMSVGKWCVGGEGDILSGGAGMGVVVGAANASGGFAVSTGVAAYTVDSPDLATYVLMGQGREISPTHVCGFLDKRGLEVS